MDLLVHPSSRWKRRIVSTLHFTPWKFWKSTDSVSSVKISLERDFLSLCLLSTSCYTEESQCYFYTSWQKPLFMDAWQNGREKKGVRSRTTMPRERFRGCFASLREEQTIEPVPPTQTISQTNCLLCGLSGGNKSFSPIFLDSLPFSHIWKHPKADAWICIWIWLSWATENTWSWTFRGSHDIRSCYLQ